MTDCSHGCTVYRRHLNACPVKDHSAGTWTASTLTDEQRDALMDGDAFLVGLEVSRRDVWIGRYGGLETWLECGGCQPRDATYGTVCENCHARLTAWLSQLSWLNGWLTANILPGNAAGAKQDWQRPGSQDGQPAPLRVAVLDVRDLLVSRMIELEDCARDVFDRPARTGEFHLPTAAAFLHAWLSKIEDDADLVNHMIELLEDLFRRARQIAPWEDRPRRISGIICPHCERTTLEVRPGNEDVSCRTCEATIPKTRYEIWTRILAGQAVA